MILDNKYYTFTNNATIKNLTKFAKREYKLNEPEFIKPPKDSMGKLIFTAKINLNNIVITLDNLGFDFLPDFAKKFMVLIFLLAPILSAILCIYLTQESPKPRPNIDQNNLIKNEEERNEQKIFKMPGKTKQD